MRTNDYFHTAETLRPQELVYGFVREAAAPSAVHQRVVGALYRSLWRHLQETAAGEVWLSPLDIVLDAERDLVVQPDLSVILSEHSDIVTDRIWGAPDLVIEVLSPRPRIGSVDERLGWFSRYGVRECWLVHVPGSQIEVVNFRDGAVQSQRFEPTRPIRSQVLPDLVLRPLDILDDDAA